MRGAPRPEALFLAHRIPYPPDKGDKIRSWRILERLVRHYDVHLAAFVDDADDFQHQEFLGGMTASLALIPLDRRVAMARSAVGFLTGEPLSFPYYRDRRMTRAVARARARPLAVEVVFSSSMAPYVAQPAGRRALVIDLCDADSAKWSAYAATRGFPMNLVYAREARRLAMEETSIINQADAAFAISREEAAVLSAGAGVQRPVGWFGNGVDGDYFDPIAAETGGRDLGAHAPADVIFTGAMDYRANADAVLWFTADIWPLIRQNHPDATFSIVGARPLAAVMALHGRNGITVTGRVQDMRPHLFRAMVAVAPMRIARGVQNKVLEGMAAGRPMVATRAAAEGLDLAFDQEIIVRDDPAGFASAVSALLSNKEQRRVLGERARARMIAAYTWERQLDRFDEALRRLGALT